MDILGVFKILSPKSTMLQKYLLLTALLTALLSGLNFLTAKMFNFYVFGSVCSVVTIFYCVTFLFTDLISECYGRKKALQSVGIMLLAQLLVIGMVIICVKLPGGDVNSPEFLDMYGSIFFGSSGIMIGSFLTVALVQVLDVFAFDFWKRVTGGRWLFVRNNLSTIVSTFVDATLFTLLGLFVFTNVGQGIADIVGVTVVSMFWTLALSSWCVKALSAVCDTPFCYLGRKWIRASVDYKEDKSWSSRKQLGYIKW